MTWQETKTKIGTFWLQIKHVLQVTRKPTSHEFKTIAKITGLGIAVIGAIGFILQVARTLITG